MDNDRLTQYIPQLMCSAEGKKETIKENNHILMHTPIHYRGLVSSGSSTQLTCAETTRQAHIITLPLARDVGYLCINVTSNMHIDMAKCLSE